MSLFIRLTLALVAIIVVLKLAAFVLSALVFAIAIAALVVAGLFALNFVRAFATRLAARRSRLMLR